MDAEIRVEGLRESVTALRRFDTEGKRAVPAALRSGATVMRNAARQAPGAPGSGSRAQSRAITSGARAARAEAWVGYTAASRRNYPWAVGNELGANRAWLWGRVSLQRNLSRRQFPSRSTLGHVIGPTVPRMVPTVEELIVEALADVLRQALDRAGVPRAGKAGR